MSSLLMDISTNMVCSVRLCPAWLQASEYTRQSSMESITIPVGPRLGDIVVEAKGVTKAYGDRTLMENLSFSIPPGSIVGAAHAFRDRLHNSRANAINMPADVVRPRGPLGPWAAFKQRLMISELQLDA